MVGTWGVPGQAAPQAVPAATGTVAAAPARTPLRERVMGALSRTGYGFHLTSWSDPAPYVAFPSSGGAVQGPPSGFRYATQNLQPTVPAQVINGPAAPQTASRPLTYQ
jgi:hypothetical protein